MLDAILAICLVGLVPAYSLWRSRGEARTPAPGMTVRMARTAALAAGLLVLLAAAWIPSGRSAAALGLSAPTTPLALSGLGLAALLLCGAAIAMALQSHSNKARPDDAEKALANLPRTRGEFAVFLPSMALICAAWELLYRGFLLWVLTPRIGLAGAVVLAATAYALAHRFTSPRQFIASLISALLFTLGYAVTHSLWWLMLLHMGLPILASLAGLSMRQADSLSRSDETIGAR